MMNFRLQQILQVIIVLFTPYSAFAQGYEGAQTSSHQAFNENYVALEFCRNIPTSDSQQRFSSGEVTTFLGFRHTLRDRWLMGLFAGFKRFKLRDDESNVTLLSISQESMYLVRLNHPFYIGIGPKLLYLLPTTTKKLPPVRDNRFNRESGIALSAAMYFTMTPKILLNFRVDRWRGVNSRTFQGYEAALGLSYGLP